MRICVMSGWPSVHTEYWLNALSERGHEVHFLFPYDHRSDFDGLSKKVISHRFSWKSRLRGIGPVAGAFELRCKLREIGPDILHVHSIFAAEKWRKFPWIAAMCTFHPLVLTAWGSDLLRVPNASKAARFIVQFAMRSADVITADAQSLLDAAHRIGVPKEKLQKLLFGVDTELFHPEIETAMMRKRVDLAPGPVVYSPRAFKPLYNQMSIVEAVPTVLKVYPDCRFVFKRRSDHHSPEYEIKVRQRIEELGIAYAVRIVSPIPYEQLPALYALSDVIVSVPESDGTPRSVLEGMACGAFPVVSDVPALHEWIKHEDNGIFISSIEAPKIAEAILRALSSRQYLDKAKLKNRRIVENRASKEVWVTQLEALYGMLCDMRG